MTDQLPAIIVLSPLFGALFVGLFGGRDRRICFPIALAALFVSLVASVEAARSVYLHGPIEYYTEGWVPGKVVEGVEIPLGFGIELKIDHLNAFVMVAVAVVVLLVSIYAFRSQRDKNTEKTHFFYALLLLLATGLFGITVTTDAFNLYVLVEVSSLTSYGLIAMGSSPRGTVAAFNYLIMGTVGASLYLLGVGYLFLKTGALNMVAIHGILHLESEVGVAIYDSQSILVAFILVMVGVWIKMAFFPLYGWLPNAYSYCPTATACVLAPLMTKVVIYVMIRMMITVFGLDWVFRYPMWSELVVWLAVIAIVAGSIFALAQIELRKMLCYLIVAEVGYMVGGSWLADPERWGLTGAMYHVLADAVMTVCLFLGVSVIFKCTGVTRIDDVDGLFGRMPLTMAALVVGALAMIGVPPTCGFFSKFYLIRGAIGSGDWEFVAALLVSSLVNAILFFRILENAFFGRRPVGRKGGRAGRTGKTPARREPEVPLNYLVPLWTSAVLIVLVGLCHGPIVGLIRRTAGLLPEVSLPVN